MPGVDEELINEMYLENMKDIAYRSKSFLFKTHMKYTLNNLIPDEIPVIEVPVDPEALEEESPMLQRPSRFGLGR